MNASYGYLSAEGWTCPNCFVWIPNGQLHTCGSWNREPGRTDTVYTALVPTWGPEWERLLVVLERIAVALERLRPGMIPSHDDVEELYK